MLRSDVYFLFPVEGEKKKKKDPKEKHDWEKIQS